jgi:hypothetical protein
MTFRRVRKMKPWKSLEIASAVTAFAATAQAECWGCLTQHRP